MKAIDELIEIAYQCQICGSLAPTYDEIKKHVQRKHREDERYIDRVALVGFKCLECEMFNQAYPAIAGHVRRMHNELVTKTNRHKIAREVREK